MSGIRTATAFTLGFAWGEYAKSFLAELAEANSTPTKMLPHDNAANHSSIPHQRYSLTSGKLYGILLFLPKKAYPHDWLMPNVLTLNYPVPPQSHRFSLSTTKYGTGGAGFIKTKPLK